MYQADIWDNKCIIGGLAKNLLGYLLGSFQALNIELRYKIGTGTGSFNIVAR